MANGMRWDRLEQERKMRKPVTKTPSDLPTLEVGTPVYVKDGWRRLRGNIKTTYRSGAVVAFTDTRAPKAEDFVRYDAIEVES